MVIVFIWVIILTELKLWLGVDCNAAFSLPLKVLITTAEDNIFILKHHEMPSFFFSLKNDKNIKNAVSYNFAEPFKD